MYNFIFKKRLKQLGMVFLSGNFTQTGVISELTLSRGLICVACKQQQSGVCVCVYDYPNMNCSAHIDCNEGTCHSVQQYS